MSHHGNKHNFPMLITLEFLAAITQHTPKRLSQAVRCLDWYSIRRGEIVEKLSN
jgi:hypothetical protein